MRIALITLVFALVWISLGSAFTLANLVFGLALGALSLALVGDQIGSAGTLSKARKIAALGVLFLRELALSALRVARIVLTPRLDLKPGIFAYRLTVDRDVEIALLANMITLTPGTLSVDVSDDRTTLYVHALDCSDPEATRCDIAGGFEAKILAALR